MLTSVATVSDSGAWAVGYHSGAAFTNVGAKALINNWNGVGWAQVAVPTTPGNTVLLLGVSASSTTDTWAVGRTQLNKSDDANATLNAISADGSGDVWIVGTFLDSATEQNETFSEHFNGTTWTVVPMPPVNSSNINTFFQFNGIKANSPSDVRAVGDSGVVDVPGSQTLIEHFNVVASPDPGSTDGADAVATNPGAVIVWAVGESGPAGRSTRSSCRAARPSDRGRKA